MASKYFKYYGILIVFGKVIFLIILTKIYFLEFQMKYHFHVAITLYP